MPPYKQQVLSRLISQIDKSQDTPSLIVLIAANIDYLWACRFVVEPPSRLAAPSTRALEHICRDYGWSLGSLRAKLGPAAKALGLTAAEASDYYRVLGVRQDADLQEIRHAFRKRAMALHPDTGIEAPTSARRFQDLNDAYQTLRDPISRRRYDIGRQPYPQWNEVPLSTLSTDGRSSLFQWYLGGLLAVFIGLLLLLDLVAWKGELP